VPQPLYAILIDLRDRLCVIVGGGTVAARKARGVIASGARQVHMIAPRFEMEIPPGVIQIQEAYRPEHLNGAGIVFAATNVATVNDAVIRDAKAMGIWASRADSDDELPGDFVSAARFDMGPVMVAVSAGSAGLSVMIRDGLAERWEASWTTLAQAMMELRPEIKRKWDEPTRREIFRDLATAEAMTIASSAGADGLRSWITQRWGAGK
jgi:precorrin-2 dehydrogenase / sirohydrochlorin ferrochelatase